MFGVVPVVPVVLLGLHKASYGRIVGLVVAVLVAVGLLVPSILCNVAGPSPSVTSAPDRVFS